MNKTVEFLTKLGSDAQLKAAYEKNPAAVLELFGLEEDISRCDSDNKAMLFASNEPENKAFLIGSNEPDNKALLFSSQNKAFLLSPNKAMLVTPNH